MGVEISGWAGATVSAGGSAFGACDSQIDEPRAVEADGFVTVGKVDTGIPVSSEESLSDMSSGGGMKVETRTGRWGVLAEEDGPAGAGAA
jgi:hypothetical protein